MVEKLKQMFFNWVSLIGAIVFTALYFSLGFSHTIFCSRNLSSTLTAVITFVSIALSFIGLLLTTVVGIKRESSVARYFFDTVDKKAFVRVINKNAFTGVASALISIVLFFSDKTGAMANALVGGIWVFFLVYFILSTFRLLNLLVTLLVRENPEANDNQKKYSNMSDEQKENLRTKSTDTEPTK